MIRARRAAGFVLLMLLVALVTTLAFAQPHAGGRSHGAPKKPLKGEAGAAFDALDSGTLTRAQEKAEKAEQREPTASKDAGSVETRTLDGGARVFRFGEVEIEGRLRSPQLVYFLRRVRAEFAAGDLGHRTFMRELSETRSDPNF